MPAIPRPFNPQGGGAFQPNQDIELTGRSRMPWNVLEIDNAAGTVQTDAAPIPMGYPGVLIVWTVGAGQGVRLPAVQNISGAVVAIKNNGANALKVYPHVGSFINDTAVNVPISVPSKGTAMMIFRWKSAAEHGWFSFPNIPL